MTTKRPKGRSQALELPEALRPLAKVIEDTRREPLFAPALPVLETFYETALEAVHVTEGIRMVLALTKSKRRRARGGGRKRVFTNTEITSLRETMRRGYAQDASLRGSLKAAGQYLRPFLPEAKRDVSLDTLTTWILQPARSK